jgi:RNA polymerase sigma-70 factor (ECF subfamily)
MVRLFGPLVYHWGRRGGLQAHDAADMVQDVFRSVLAGIEGFRRDQPGDSFRGWLWTISQNRIRDHYRRRNKQPQPQGGPETEHAWEQISDPVSQSASSNLTDEASLVRRALAVIQGEFEPNTWKAFWKAAVEGQPANEIAADLGMTAGAVRQAKYRVLLRLRRELEPLA